MQKRGWGESYRDAQSPTPANVATIECRSVVLEKKKSPISATLEPWEICARMGEIAWDVGEKTNRPILIVAVTLSKIGPRLAQYSH